MTNVLHLGDLSEPLNLYRNLDLGTPGDLKRRFQSLEDLSASILSLLTGSVEPPEHTYEQRLVVSGSTPDTIHTDNFGMPSIRVITNVSTDEVFAEIARLPVRSSDNTTFPINSNRTKWTVPHDVMSLRPGWSYVLNNTPRRPCKESGLRPHRAVNTLGRAILNQTYWLLDDTPRKIYLPVEGVSVSAGK